MKVLIWVHKNDVINNKITNYYLYRQPQSTDWMEYVQVELTRDEFVRLEDKQDDFNERRDFFIEQYNRNKPADEHVSTWEELQERQKKDRGNSNYILDN